MAASIQQAIQNGLREIRLGGGLKEVKRYYKLDFSVKALKNIATILAGVAAVVLFAGPLPALIGGCLIGSGTLGLYQDYKIYQKIVELINLVEPGARVMDSALSVPGFIPQILESSFHFS